MLPKIVALSASDDSEICSLLGLEQVKVNFFNGEKAVIKDLRRFVAESMNGSLAKYGGCVVIKDADKLSAECQMTLLKPLEEKHDLPVYLTVRDANGLLPTILSRCEVLDFRVDQFGSNTKYFSELIKVMKMGPAWCIQKAEEMEKEDMISSLEEMILTLKMGLKKEINDKRLLIIEKALSTHNLLVETNVNPKHAFGCFLLDCSRIIKVGL